MKIYQSILFSMTVALTLTGCERHLEINTVVNEDSSLDRSITIYDADSTQEKRNIFGVSTANGWALTKIPRTSSDVDAATSNNKIKKSGTLEYNFRFQKHFDSSEASNKDLNSGKDTLFNIQTTFEKKFRWFYTYISFSETYKALNRFKHVSPADYFTPEDYAFIERLPAEGKKISRADSLFLDQLNDKIYDIYATRGFFEEYFHGFNELMKDNKSEQRWIDSLQYHKEDFYRAVTKDKNNLDEERFMIQLADSMKIAIPATVRKLYSENDPGISPNNKHLQALLRFMNESGEGKYTHTIQMPWDIVSSNGDSLAGNTIIWNPPVTKFLLTDYTFRAESRKLNYWTIAVSLLIVGGTIWLFVRKGEFVWEVKTKS